MKSVGAILEDYVSGVRVEGCVCGGIVEAIAGNDRSVMFAVQAHQRTMPHILWRAEMEARRSSTWPYKGPVVDKEG